MILNETASNSSNLFIVPEETEFETRNSTAEKVAAKPSPSRSKIKLIFSKENNVAKARTPSSKVPTSFSGIGRGLRKTSSKQKLQTAMIDSSSLLDISAASLGRSQFADVSILTAVDDSQLIHETKLTSKTKRPHNLLKLET